MKFFWKLCEIFFKIEGNYSFYDFIKNRSPLHLFVSMSIHAALPYSILANISLTQWKKTDIHWIALMLLSNVTMLCCGVTLYNPYMSTMAFTMAFCYATVFKCGSYFTLHNHKLCHVTSAVHDEVTTYKNYCVT